MSAESTAPSNKPAIIVSPVSAVSCPLSSFIVAFREKTLRPPSTHNPRLTSAVAGASPQCNPYECIARRFTLYFSRFLPVANKLWHFYGSKKQRGFRPIGNHLGDFDLSSAKLDHGHSCSSLRSLCRTRQALCQGRFILHSENVP